MGTLINNCVKFLAAGTLSFSDRLQSLAAKIHVVWRLDRNEQHCFLLPLILIKKDTNDWLLSAFWVCKAVSRQLHLSKLRRLYAQIISMYLFCLISFISNVGTDVKGRISIKIRDESIWHGASPHRLSRGGQGQGLEWAVRGRVCCGDKEAGADGAVRGRIFEGRTCPN